MAKHVTIAGSEPNLQGSKLVGAPAPDDRLEISLHLRVNPDGPGLPSVAELAAVPLHKRQY